MMIKVILYLFAAGACCVTANPSQADESMKIINGGIAAENQFPYVASIQLINQQTQPGRGHRCGGVLITLQHVLTTATCLHDNVNGNFQQINASSYQVFGGSSLLTSTSPERIRPVANFTISNDFIPSSFLHDIAIVTLLLPFPVGVVTPLPLPAASYDPADFTLCTVAGWGGGSVNDQSASQALRFATKYTYSQSLCTQLFNLQPEKPNVMPTMMCAASFDSISTGCNGDSGNALVCNNTLTGIMFYHGGCEPTTFPELYTRVNNYTTWIRSITGSAHTLSSTSLTLALVLIFQIYSVIIS